VRSQTASCEAKGGTLQIHNLAHTRWRSLLQAANDASVGLRTKSTMLDEAAMALHRDWRILTTGQTCLILSGTTPPLSASFCMTCSCSQMFISADPVSSPL
jgi:hypothetical protein